jgi:hypothetical protein
LRTGPRADPARFPGRIAHVRRVSFGPVAFAGEWLVHEPEHRAALVQQSDQRAPHRCSGDEGACPVDGIDHPLQGRRCALLPELFADDAVLRRAGANHAGDGAFGGFIRLRDGIEGRAAGLVAHSHRFAKLWQYDPTRRIR